MRTGCACASATSFKCIEEIGGWDERWWRAEEDVDERQGEQSAWSSASEELLAMAVICDFLWCCHCLLMRQIGRAHV